MPTAAELRHHIGAVEDTGKITKAMHLISSSKMKKALEMHDANLHYFQRVRSIIRFILENTDSPLHHAYFRQPQGRRAAYLVITADKGLCGGYNQNVLRLAQKQLDMGDYAQAYLFTVGAVGSEHFQRLGLNPDINYLHVIQDPSLEDAREITYELCGLYDQGMLDEIYVVYTVMESMTKLTPTVLRLLPILRMDFFDVALYHAPTSLTYHPSPERTLAELVPHYLIGLVYSTLVQSFASEQCARMMAMKAATDNADEMLGRLKQQLNHARQAQITQEITEIVSGAEAGESASTT